MMEFKGITKFYGDKKASDDISFTLNDGDLCGFIGANGAGKSTLIKIATGIIAFDAGDVLVDGISIRSEPEEYKKLISYVPDIPYIYEYMSPNDFWNFLLDIYEVDNISREKAIEKYSAMFEMTAHLNQPISSFSKGMKQKVTLIAAFLHPARVYILDEPFSGLDPKSILVLKKIIKEKSNENCSVLFSTHLLDVAEKLCNRIVAIKKGKVIFDEEFKGVLSANYKFEEKLIGEIYDEDVEGFVKKR